MSIPRSPLRTLALTVASLGAFSANSLLCRLALEGGFIDPGSFNLIRLGSGALVLWMLVALGRARTRTNWDWWSALWLFLYGLAFALAYARLGTGSGALILFGSVQLSMFLAGRWGGERPGGQTWAGLALAGSGLVWLNAPGLTAPPWGAAHLMVVAGVAWGLDSLRGRRARDPVTANAASLGLAAGIALAALPVLPGERWLTAPGLLLALLAGGLAPALGYMVWYAALKGLSATAAAVVQLLVPILAALVGALWLGEVLTPRLLIAFLAVLGGVLLVLVRREPNRRTDVGTTKPLLGPCRPEISPVRTESRPA